MRIYSIKKNYNELPAYLNYMVLKSNPFFEKFFYTTVKNNELNKIKLEDGDKPSHHDIIKYICKNLDRLFDKYTNYGCKVLIKLQIIQFYKLQPPQATILSPYFPIYNSKKEDIKRKPKYDVPKCVEDIDSKYNNPFNSRLNKGCDIFPRRKSELEFVESDII
jgi:hypothetical protein